MSDARVVNHAVWFVSFVVDGEVIDLHLDLHPAVERLCALECSGRSVGGVKARAHLGVANYKVSGVERTDRNLFHYVGEDER